MTPLAVDGPPFVTLMLYVMLPTALIFAGPDFVTATFAEAETVVTTCAFVNQPSLFVAFKSNVALLPEAMFVNVPPSIASKVTVRFVLPFAGNVGIVHVTRFPFALPPPLALTNVQPESIAFVTTTFVAIAGPRFVTATTNTRLFPATPLVGPDCCTSKSAVGVTLMVMVAFELLFTPLLTRNTNVSVPVKLFVGV